jgi:hypothetical protein
MMGGVRVGILGMDAGAGSGPDGDAPIDVLGSGDPPGTLGADDAVPLSTGRTIAYVRKDWDPTSPLNTDPLVISGKTLDRVFRALNALPEWGLGGGRLVVDDVPRGSSPDVTVTLHANLIRRMPSWTEYQNASEAAQAEWNRMYRKLVDHEDRHVEIAAEEAERLAGDLVGKDISKIPKLVTTANARMAARQKEMDTASKHGAKPGVQYGDVLLDPTIV